MSATPWPAGPWRAVVNKDRSINIISARNDEGESEKIALINGRDKDAARLIQHAPEMAEALMELRLLASNIPAVERNPRFAEMNQRILQLLSRIRGETP